MHKRERHIYVYILVYKFRYTYKSISHRKLDNVFAKQRGRKNQHFYIFLYFSWTKQNRVTKHVSLGHEMNLRQLQGRRERHRNASTDAVRSYTCLAKDETFHVVTQVCSVPPPPPNPPLLVEWVTSVGIQPLDRLKIKNLSDLSGWILKVPAYICRVLSLKQSQALCLKCFMSLSSSDTERC
jgi:hypothetical protein